MLTVAGFVRLMDPWVSVAAMGMTVGIVFVPEGVSSIVCACISRTKEEPKKLTSSSKIAIE